MSQGPNVNQRAHDGRLSITDNKEGKLAGNGA